MHPSTATASVVPGLRYVPAYVSDQECRQILEQVDAQPWLTTLKRRVQHWGWRYDYTRRTVEASDRLGPLPEWLAALTHRFLEDGLTSASFDQAIFNEYEPGQGISPHVDCTPCFAGTILTLSLGSPCVMVFSHKASGTKAPLLLEPGSLLIMEREARYDWRHGIPPRQADLIDGRRVMRNRRVSLTFRSVIPR
jgi:alkylated DNA repair dioxygenase AlkB